MTSDPKSNSATGASGGQTDGAETSPDDLPNPAPTDHQDSSIPICSPMSGDDLARLKRDADKPEPE